MQFRIADTFTASLGRLTNDEQKAVKITVFDLQSDPVNPGLQMHRIDRCRDPHFWSARVGRDIRLILHKTDASLLICYVDHHDKAYDWATRRKIETHPRTGAAQIVEIRELVREIEIPRYVEPDEAASAPAAPRPTAPALRGVSEQQLLDYGVPEEWIEDALTADEDTLLRMTDHLPSEAAEAVLSLATGTVPPLPAQARNEDPFLHPDAERRFRVMTDSEELRQALEYPWERWTVFLHPDQRETVDREYSGPARVSGSAGTGKTIVALHRAVRLATKYPEGKVLLATFSIPLARDLRTKADRLIGERNDLKERISVRSLDEFALERYESQFGLPKVLTRGMLSQLIRDEVSHIETRLSPTFVEGEWLDVIDAWQISTWEAYRDVPRLGRKTRLGEKQREALWPGFERVRATLDERGLVTMPMVYAALTRHAIETGEVLVDGIVVDEAQDLSVSQLRFLAAIAGGKPDGLFFAGDLGQRIFQAPFSWSSLGVDIRGRSKTLRINYRTSHQIRSAADRLLDSKLSDVDGNEETRRGTVSVFNGPTPEIRIGSSAEDEVRLVAEWLSELADLGVSPHEFAIIVRSSVELPRARAMAKAAGLETSSLDDDAGHASGTIAIVTMHRAKGLEFRAVVVGCCDDEVIPSQDRISTVADSADLSEIYNTERHLLYVACTRARDYLLVSGVAPASEFLDDLAIVP